MSSRFEPIFEKLVGRARGENAEVEMFTEKAEQLKISFQQRQMHKFTSNQSQCAGIRVILNDIAGYANTENFSDEALLQGFDLALSNAKFKSAAGRPKVAARLFAPKKAAVEMKELANDSLVS